MKRIEKITGILLMLLIAGSVSLSAQRGMRGMMDSTRMDRMKMGPGMGRMQNGMGPDSVMMKKMHQDMMMNMGAGMGMGRMGQRGQSMNRQPMQRMGRGMGRLDRSSIRGGMGQMPINDMGMRPMGPMGPERMIMESLPNVTEKQKKDMADLRLQQQEDMKKMREEMIAKMKTMRDSHQAKMLELLTPEQKKFIEEKSGKTLSAPSKTPAPAKTK